MTPTTSAQPEQWFTLQEAAALCRRHPKTLKNLISLYQLPKRTSWMIRNRVRKRALLLSPSVVAYLQRITLHGEDVRTLHRPTR